MFVMLDISEVWGEDGHLCGCNYSMYHKKHALKKQHPARSNFQVTPTIEQLIPPVSSLVNVIELRASCFLIYLFIYYDDDDDHHRHHY